MNRVDLPDETTAERRLRLLSEYSRDVVCELREGVVTYVSPNTRRVSGLEPEAFIGHRFEDIVHPDDVSVLQPFLARGWSGTIQATVRVITGDGRWQHREAHGVREIDGAGVHTTMLVLRDVDDRQRAEQATAESESRSRALLTAVPDLMFRLSRDGRYLEFKAERAEELAAPPETVIGSYVHDLLPPELAQAALESIRRALDEGGVHTLEYSLAKPIGHREMEGRMVACGDNEVLLITRDVTDRKRLERELLEREAKYRALVERARDVVYTIDLAGNFTSVNPAVTSAFGYTPEEILTMNLAQVVDPQHIPYLLENAQFAMRGERIGQPVEFLIWSKDGSSRWVEVVATPINGEAGVAGFQGIARDINSRKQAEEQVHFQAELLDAINQAVFVVDPGGAIVFWSKSAGKLYGRSADEIVGRHIATFAPAEDRADAMEAYGHLVRGERWTGEVIAETVAGKTFPTLVDISPIHDARGAPIGVACVTAEIGALKRAQQEAQSARDKAALGDERARIAQELHDDVAQYFFAIGIAATDLAERGSVARTILSGRLADIRRLSAEGSREIRKAINALTTTPEAVSLKVALEPVLQEARETGLRVDYKERGQRLVPPELNSLLFMMARELLFNARKHARATEVHVHLNAGVRQITLAVEDNGAGCATDVRSKMDEGTGFGLRNLRLRVADRGGKLVLTDRKTGGLRVVLKMPYGGAS